MAASRCQCLDEDGVQLATSRCLCLDEDSVGLATSMCQCSDENGVGLVTSRCQCLDGDGVGLATSRCQCSDEGDAEMFTSKTAPQRLPLISFQCVLCFREACPSHCDAPPETVVVCVSGELEQRGLHVERGEHDEAGDAVGLPVPALLHRQ